MKTVFIKTSKVQGKGVFAAKNFQREEEILEIDDSRIVEDESILTAEDWAYNADVVDGKIIIMQEPERSINHSCDPNSYIKTVDTARKVFAIRDIADGEEITFDYAINGNNEGTFPCTCGVKRCRKIYVGNFFKLPLELQLEYLPYLDNWFIEQHRDKITMLQK